MQLRLAYVSCVRQLEEGRHAEYCDYIRPPIDKYGTLQFDAFEEIRDVGYYHGQVRNCIQKRLLSSVGDPDLADPHVFGPFYLKCWIQSDRNNAYQFCGSGIRCPFDPCIRDPVRGKNSRSGSGMNITDHISESLETIF